MRKDRDFRPLAYLIIVLGACLAFAAAVVPFYETGYLLRLDVLVISLLPYLVYGLFTDVVRGGALLVAGVLVFGVDLAVKIPERFMHYNDYASNIIYWVPAILSAVAVVILAIGARRENRWYGESQAEEISKHHE